ncbi:MAG: hypothetical protein R3B13_10385 [Polyangiaceae bacterium]
MKLYSPTSVCIGAALLVVAFSSDGNADQARGVSYSVGVSENGAPLSQVKLDATGGKIPLPRGAWKCDYGASESAQEGDHVRAGLEVKCSMGAAVVKLHASCRYSGGPVRAETDVLRDAQGMTLTVPNGKYTAFITVGCEVH